MPPWRCADQPPGVHAPAMTSQPQKAFQGLRKATWRAACLRDDEPAHPCSWRWKPPEGPSARQVPGPTAGRAEPTRQVTVCGNRCPGRRPQLGAGLGAPWRGRESAMNGPGLLAHHGLLRAPAQLPLQQPGLTRGKRWGWRQGSGSEALLCLWPQLSPNIRNRRGPQFQLFRDTTHYKRARQQ